MALSYEYTFWHLTQNGWVSGDSRTDFNSWTVDAPQNSVLTIRYEETVKHPSKGLEISIERSYESTNKALLQSLETKFPFKGRIVVY